MNEPVNVDDPTEFEALMLRFMARLVADVCQSRGTEPPAAVAGIVERMDADEVPARRKGRSCAP